MVKHGFVPNADTTYDSVKIKYHIYHVDAFKMDFITDYHTFN